MDTLIRGFEICPGLAIIMAICAILFVVVFSAIGYSVAVDYYRRNTLRKVPAAVRPLRIRVANTVKGKR